VKTKILIADDHPICLQGLVSLIEKEPSFSVVAQVTDGMQALRQIKKIKPDIAILDISMPKLSGLDVAKKVKDKKLNVSIIILTMYKEIDFYDEAVSLGVQGFVLKDNAANILITAISLVLKGKRFKCPVISEQLKIRNKKRKNGNKFSIKVLTSAEKQVLKCLSKNKTNKEIAVELSIRPRTAQNHRASMCSKLNLKGMNALLKYAIENKSKLKYLN
jgi:DNA-binding NarL/FixJ family response regulator